MSQLGDYPSGYYRVATKALIRNDKNEVLVCEEWGLEYNLPGGAIEHGEEVEAALVRELNEEIGVSKVESLEFKKALIFYVEHKKTWNMWLVYDVDIGGQELTAGKGVTELKFEDPAVFQNSSSWSEPQIYRACLG